LSTFAGLAYPECAGAAHSILILACTCEFFALEGLSHLLNTVNLVKENLNTHLAIKGVVLTMYDKRNRLTEQVEADVRAHLPHYVFKTVIPRNVKVSEAPSHGKPALIYDFRCPGSQSYIHLAREFFTENRTFNPCRIRNFMETTIKNRPLGRGLSALISSSIGEIGATGIAREPCFTKCAQAACGRYGSLENSSHAVSLTRKICLSFQNRFAKNGWCNPSSFAL